MATAPFSIVTLTVGNMDEFGTFVLSETLKFWKYYFKSVVGDCCSFKSPGETGNCNSRIRHSNVVDDLGWKRGMAAWNRVSICSN
jgi:hypothetical protein